MNIAMAGFSFLFMNQIKCLNLSFTLIDFSRLEEFIFLNKLFEKVSSFEWDIFL